MKKYKNINTLMACRYCPMCRHVCSSGVLSRHESDFPRGRALILYSIWKGTVEYNTNIINSIYNCFLCGCCWVYCEGGYDMPKLIEEARENIVNSKKDLDICKKIRESLIKNDNPYCIEKRFSFKFSRSVKAEVLYYMGPEINFRNHEIAESVINILDMIKENYTILKNEPDCGKILSLLGYVSDAKDKAKALYERIKNTGCKIIIVSSPLCYDAFINNYPQWGFRFEPDIKIYHLSEYLYNSYTDGKIKLDKLTKKVTIADSEYLGLFNDVFEAPRNLIKLSAEENFIEMGHNRRDLLATGEAAFIFNGKEFNLGAKIGEKICEMAKEVGANIIVTLSAKAKENLKKCSSLEVLDIAEFVNKLI